MQESNLIHMTWHVQTNYTQRNLVSKGTSIVDIVYYYFVH